MTTGSSDGGKSCATPSEVPEAIPPEVPAPEIPLLTSPAEGVPPVVEDAAALAEVVRAMTAGHGPVAVDAERAHGFRYSQRAYLIQLRRAGSGTHLIDPIAMAEDGGPADLSELGAAIADAEWIVHAASQDLPCLAEVGLVPQRLFDSELAGRLLDFPRVNLGTLLAELFHVRLLKEHSAADWSTRPLPAEWLKYAALDVELLIELRDELAGRLVDAGKDEWARQEFAALAASATRQPAPRVDPWRRTSGMHKVRTRRGLAIVRELWQARDEIARRNDRAPGRVLPDLAISELAGVRTPRPEAYREVAMMQRRSAKRYERNWVAAYERAITLTESQLPPLHLASDLPPQARVWASRDPIAAARLSRVRSALLTLAGQLGLPVENLLTPEYVRRLAWEPPAELSAEAVDAELDRMGARPWQRELTSAVLAEQLGEPAPVVPTPVVPTPTP
ncbi:MAG: HRDC domain-containing protein [Propionibacteriaceae bacterium]